MPDIKREDKEKNIVKFTFIVSQEEARPYLEEAAERLSAKTNIPGFRPGKASYGVIKNRVGEMKILEEALETIIRKSFIEAVLAENIDTVGSPKIEVEKLAPENDIIFTTEVTRMPKTTTLADFRKLNIEKKSQEISEKDVELALKDLRRMQTKEIRAQSGAGIQKNDKVVVSMNMKQGGVPVDGGQSPNHAIYLAEEYYIPGLKEELLGLKEGDEKQFSLTFPDTHPQKLISGKSVDFEITIKEIFTLEPPQLDDEFAKSLRLKDLQTLKQVIKENMLKEKEQDERFRQEKEMLELLAKESRFENIPDLLVNEEINKMIGELQRGVENQGAVFEEYLTNIKKTLATLKIDFAQQALMRVKVALVMREIANSENIKISDDELDEQIDKFAEQYEGNDAKEQVYSPQYRDYVEQLLKNQKVIELLRETMVH